MKSVAKRFSTSGAAFEGRNHGSVVDAEIDVFEVKDEIGEGGTTIVNSCGFEFGDDAARVVLESLRPGATSTEDLSC